MDGVLRKSTWKQKNNATCRKQMTCQAIFFKFKQIHISVLPKNMSFRPNLTCSNHSNNLQIIALIHIKFPNSHTIIIMENS